MNKEELQQDLNESLNNFKDKELEIQRLITCYRFASGDDRKVIWAVLNKYVPLLSAEGFI